MVNGDCYWISFADLPDDDLGYLLVAVANSALADPDSPSARRLVALSRELCASPNHPDPQLIHQVDALVEASFRTPG